MIFMMIWCLIGAMVLRPVIPDNNRYFLACFFYGVFLAIGKAVIDTHTDNNGE